MPPSSANLNTLQPSLKDTELVSQVLQGDAKAFAILMNRYLPLVYNYLYRMTQNHEMSEEMAQDAFVKAYQHLDGFDRNRSFKPWILRIASNAAISQLRKQSKVVSLDALEEEGAWGEPEDLTQEEPLVRMERAFSTEEVMTALQAMDMKYRQVLLLRYQEELSYEEISQVLNIPLNTIRTWLKRGTEKLRQKLKENLKPEVKEQTS